MFKSVDEFLRTISGSSSSGPRWSRRRQLNSSRSSAPCLDHKAIKERLYQLSAMVEQTMTNERLQQLTAAVERKATIEQLTELNAIVEQKVTNERFQQLSAAMDGIFKCKPYSSSVRRCSRM